MTIPVICEGCGKEYVFKEEYGGKKIKCSECGNVLVVPLLLAPVKAWEQDDKGDLDPAFQRDKFLLRQKHFSISTRYEVWDEAGEPIMYVERPTHLARGCLAVALGVLVLIAIMGGGLLLSVTVFEKTNEILPIIGVCVSVVLGVVACVAVLLAIYPKRHIYFYADKDQRELILEVLQDKKFAVVHATYTCNDPAGNRLGSFHKNYLYNAFRRRWYCYDADGELLAVAKEDSIILSMLRRVLGDYLFGLLRTNFIILKPDHDTLLGEFNRKFTLLDRYVLDMTRDRQGVLDRRLAIALGVLLDTGENR